MRQTIVCFLVDSLSVISIRINKWEVLSRVLYIKNDWKKEDLCTAANAPIRLLEPHSVVWLKKT